MMGKDGLIHRYYRQYPLCGYLGNTYNIPKNKLTTIHCMKWRCVKCRPKLRYMLYLEILKNVYSFDMDKHFIITFGGKPLRKKITWDYSYIFMNKAWHKFNNVIKYHYPDFKYIVLPRSQNDMYCHYHIITNQYIPWNFLDEKRKKYNLGFVSINKNQSLAEYLHGDFFNDYEYIIPLNIRHYRSSREIKLFNHLKQKQNTVFFDYEKDFEYIKNYIKKEYLIDYDFFNFWEDNHIKNIYTGIENYKKSDNPKYEHYKWMPEYNY